jgi:hypothetical protein
MTTNKQRIYLNVKTEDIVDCYKLFKKYNLVEQIIKQLNYKTI